MDNKVEKELKIRRWVQIGSAIAGNGYLRGFKTGDIYQGPIKNTCVPFLNCYSCPGALCSCPIGAIQSVVSEAAGKFDLNAIPYLVIGFLMLIGSLVGRAVCGWTCPFGFLQDLINKFPSKKFKGVKWLSYIKYVILIVFVFVLQKPDKSVQHPDNTCIPQDDQQRIDQNVRNDREDLAESGCRRPETCAAGTHVEKCIDQYRKKQSAPKQVGDNVFY